MSVKTYGSIENLKELDWNKDYKILILESKNDNTADGKMISLTDFIIDIINSEKFNTILQDKLPNKRINTIVRELLDSEELKELIKKEVKSNA